jgi:CheY-like chemotaxis protein
MATQSPNVLLLDQDDVLRTATALLLKHRGAGVSPAATVEEAIALSQLRPYDVALLDISPSMPRAPELLGRLRTEGLAARRVVVCTDAPLPRDEAGDFSEVLLKPYPFDRLMEAIFGAPQPGAGGKPRAPIVPRGRGGAARAARRAAAARRAPRARARSARRRSTPGARVPARRHAQRSAARALRSPRRAARGRQHPG